GDVEGLGAQATDETLRRWTEVLRLLGGHPPSEGAVARLRLALGHDGARLGLRPLVVLGVHGVRVVCAHAASSAVSCDDTISAYVSEVSSSSLWVPSPTMRPFSSTMIWSEFLIDATRCATMMRVASARCSLRAARSRASVAESSAENESSKM